MSVPAGYKATEVGVIPEDWEVEKLGGLLSQKPSYGINAPAVVFDDRLPRYLRITDIAEDGTFSASSAVSVSHPLADRYYLEAGDVVFARTGASTGKSYRYREIDGRLVYAGFLIRVTPDPKRLNSTYLAAHVQTQNFDKYVTEVSQRSGQPGINSKQLAGFELAVPPTVAEQSAIAEALSDMDEAIAAQEAVIAKKRALKTATMQALLSGTRRLPGFSGEWVIKQFGLLTMIRNEKVQTFCANVAAFCVELEHIESGSGQLSSWADARSRASSKYHFRSGDVLFGRLRPYLRKFWSAQREGVCSTEIWPLTPRNSDITSAYLYQIVQTEAFIEAASTAYGTHMPRADWKFLSQFEIFLPSDVVEQDRIAEVLNDIDLGMQSCTHALDKLRSLRAGIMQQLLTGKIRLT